MKNIYEYFNKIETFKLFNNFFDQNKLDWKLKERIASFSSNFSGKQKDSLLENLIKFLSNKGLIKTSMNLDMDFSISGEGYVRGGTEIEKQEF